MNPLITFENLLQKMKLNVTKGGINYIQRHTLKDRFTEVGKFDIFVFVYTAKYYFIKELTFTITHHNFLIKKIKRTCQHDKIWFLNNIFLVTNLAITTI
jgi:hypothetical protein